MLLLSLSGDVKPMSDALTKEEYHNRLENDAEHIIERSRDRVNAGHYDDMNTAVLEIADDVVNDHQWFARSYYGGELYGSVIEHDTAQTNEYTDWEVACDYETPERALMELARKVYLADVADKALNEL